MSENQSENQEPIMQVWPNDPSKWENEDQVSLIGFFKAILEADMGIDMLRNLFFESILYG